MRANIIKDNCAQGGIVSFFIGAMIAVVVALQVAWPVMDASIYGGLGTATGTLTFSGNVTNGELVNVTNGGGEIYRFEFNSSNNGSAMICRTTNCISVNLSGSAAGANGEPDLYNSSNRAYLNLTTAINNNASVAAMVTASNVAGVSTNATKVAAIATGKSYNSIATSENGAQTAWGATTLTGGGDRATKNMSTSATTLVDQLPLFLVLVLLMVFVRAVI